MLTYASTWEYTCITDNGNTKQIDERFGGYIMCSIEIIHLARLHGNILLMVHRNVTSNEREVTLFIDTYGISQSQENGKITLPKEMASVLSDEFAFNNKEPNGNMIDLCIELEESLLQATEVWCGGFGVTVEKLVVAFLHFCIHPENREAVRDWLLQ